VACITSAKDDGTQTIVSLAKENGDFKTFLSALNAANLTDTLNGTGTFTVFAPTDITFAALPKGTMEALLKDPSKLKKVLLYHVAGQKLMAKYVVKMSDITTLEGQKLPVKITKRKSL
jgi:transforming growth factor-beta-induced protein